MYERGAMASSGDVRTSAVAGDGVASGSSDGRSSSSGSSGSHDSRPQRSQRQRAQRRGRRHGGGGDSANVHWTYVPVRLIGEGTFGVVVQARIAETGEDVAIKRVRYDSRLHNRELVIMRDVLSRARSHSGSDSSSSSSRSSFSSSGSGGSGDGDDGVVARTQQQQQQQQQKQQAQDAHAPRLAAHHPNVVQLRSHYFTIDHDTGERFLHLVMSYLPMDLQAAKRRGWAALSSAQTTPATTAAATSHTAGQTAATTTTSANEHDTAALSTSQLRMWARVILFQLARALTYLHAHHVCHRDVKPANILLDPASGRVQLGDFGSAKQIRARALEKNVSYICSRYYRAPELLFGALHYGTEVDVWSLGCIAVELLRPRGDVLFRGATTVDQMAEIFKVLGAPSTQEMYAMNPQCAAAMLHTHTMLYPYHHTTNTRAPASPPSSPSLTLSPAATTAASNTAATTTAAATNTVTGHDGHDGDDTSAMSAADTGHHHDDNDSDVGRHAHPTSATTSLSSSPPPPAPSSPPRHGNVDADDADSSDMYRRRDYFDYYDVLKIRAMRWCDVLGHDTPAEAIDLVARLLCYTPAKRMTAAAVVEHAFFAPLFHDHDGDNDNNTHTASSLSSRAHDEPRLPNGRLLPVDMFTLTATESRLYSRAFQDKMAREAALLRQRHACGQ